MRPRICSGDLCTVVPVRTGDSLQVGDVVLRKVRGTHYLHLIKASQGQRYLIGNNHGRINGWVGQGAIYGRLLAVEK